jgi:hypothetical protein
MRRTTIALTIISAASLLIAAPAEKQVAAIPLNDIGESTVILGELRRPIGEEVTIHGYKFTNGPLDDCFFVQTLNGKKFEPGTTVQIPSIRDWPEKTEATIRGYEEGTIRFLDLKDSNFGPRDERFHPHQAIFLRFHVVKLIAPQNLKLGAEK